MNALNLYDLAGWALAVGGIALVLMGLFSRRIVVRKTRRCGGCGYELPEDEEPTAIRCSECGRVPRSGIELYTLRRWRMFLGLGLLACLSAVLVSRVPQIRVQGWASALPVSVQIRLWEAGDKRLRDRIENLYRNSRLSTAQQDLLRRQIRDAISDPNQTPTLLAETTSYFNAFGNNPILLTERDLSTALQHGSANARSLLVTVRSWRSIPETPELLGTRRNLVDDPDRNLSRNVWEWIIKSPGDEADLDLITEGLLSADRERHLDVRHALEKADPKVVDHLVSLAPAADERARGRLAGIYAELVRRYERSEPLNPEVYRLVIEDIGSPNDQIRRGAWLSIEDFPQTTQADLEALYRAPHEDELTRSLLYGFRRMDEWAAALIPAVHSIAEDPTRSIEIRLDAHDACMYVRSRSRFGEVSSPMPIYIDALNQMDLRSDEGIMRLGRQFTGIQNPALLAALAIVLDRGGIESAAAADAWLAHRPALETLIKISGDDLGPGYEGLMIPSDRLRAFMEQALETPPDDQEITEALGRGLEVLASDASATSP